MKYIKPSMKFNPGLKKYEPELPLRKRGRKVQSKVDWKWILIILGSLIIIGLMSYWLMVYY
ncbi:MAG TPA: hypothetical protein ENG87_05200 [Candidatus Pacearchaeota archaeon]|nr:hypothetical protein BMS3Abin17_00836 [archaeon BMS3Abin17]HDK42754.1 hypothetical protein [Candidatus Pacearchaeota archaeon]HDZ60723.1 hypothetical protein [Candidatus Pacearchaeota archaeon]